MRNVLSNMAHISDVLASALHENATANADERVRLRGHPGKGWSGLMFGMPRLLGRAEAIGANVAHVENDAINYYRIGERMCESPIERSMLSALITGDWGDIGALPPVVHDAGKGSHEMLPKSPVVIVPQMAFIRMRLDFGLVVVKHGRRQVVAVECDGKAYHQDAAKESERVAYLNSWDIPVFKFTGSELHDDAINAADKVIYGIHQWWES